MELITVSIEQLRNHLMDFDGLAKGEYIGNALIPMDKYQRIDFIIKRIKEDPLGNTLIKEEQ